MSMDATRPSRYPRPEPKPEAMFNVTVVFNDDEPDVLVAEVSESELVSMYQVLGNDGGRMSLQPTPGFHYFTAANRIKHITATLIETSN